MALCLSRERRPLIRSGKFLRGDVEVQTEASLKAVQHCLESAGTSLDKVVMVRVYASNAGSIKRSIGSTLASFRRTHPRAPSCRSLAWPMEFDIEIECVAMA